MDFSLKSEVSVFFFSSSGWSEHLQCLGGNGLQSVELLLSSDWLDLTGRVCVECLKVLLMCFLLFFLWLFSWRRSFGLFLAMNVLRRLESGSFSVCTFCFYSHFRCQKTDSSSPKLLHQHHSICTFTTVKRAHGPAAPDPALWFKETVQPKKHHSVVICSPRVTETHMTDCGEIFREMSQCSLSIQSWCLLLCSQKKCGHSFV